VTSRAKWLLFVLIVLFPLALTAVTLEVGTARTREVAFCSSCHTMQPFVTNMLDEKAQTLAARHYDNRWIPREQCYTCHVNYGLFGAVDAKLRSVRHAGVFYLTGGLKRPKLYHPYPNSNCLHCHAGGAPFEKAVTHEPMKSALAKGDISCLTCHGPAHPGGAVP